MEIASDKYSGATNALEAMRSLHPEHMCPRKSLTISRFPLTISGKIDRVRLISAAKEYMKQPRIEETDVSSSGDILEDELIAKINSCIGQHIRKTIGPAAIVPGCSDCDLTSYGIASIDAASIAHSLGKKLNIPIPTRTLLRRCLRSRDIATLSYERKDGRKNVAQGRLADHLQRWTNTLDAAICQTVFLTGATGFLGKEILLQLLERPSTAKS